MTRPAGSGNGFLGLMTIRLCDDLAPIGNLHTLDDFWQLIMAAKTALRPLQYVDGSPQKTSSFPVVVADGCRTTAIPSNLAAYARLARSLSHSGKTYDSLFPMHLLGMLSSTSRRAPSEQYNNALQRRTNVINPRREWLP